MEWHKGAYVLTDDSDRVDVEAVHAWLTATYWAKERSKDVVRQSLSGSLCLSMFEGAQQVAFCRAVTDGLTHAWITDVVVREDMRGRGLGKWMLSVLVDHPVIRDTSQLLGTRDAHGLYARYGFVRGEYMRRRGPQGD